MPLSSWFLFDVAEAAVASDTDAVASHDGKALFAMEIQEGRLHGVTVFSASIKTCPTRCLSSPSMSRHFSVMVSCAGAAEIGKLLDLKITIPICIDIVRITLIAPTTTLCKALTAWSAIIRTCFRPTGPANPIGAPVICSTTVGVASSRFVTRRSPLNLDLICLMSPRISTAIVSVPVE